MKRLFLILPILMSAFASWPAHAANIITATITVTNAPTTNGQTIAVNGDTRTWTNSVIVPSSQILTNSTIAGSATNLFNAVADAPFLNLNLAMIGSAGINLQTAPGGALSVSLSPGWGSVVFITNVLTSAAVVRMPITVEYPSNQTSIATYLAQALELSTYGLSATAAAMSNYDSVSQAQTITGKKTLLSPTTTNELSLNGFYSNPTDTNGVNYGNAFSSPGTNSSTEQFGSGAAALTSGAQVFGRASSASGSGSLAIGGSVLSVGQSASSLGSGSTANGQNATSLGAFANSAGQNSTAVGEGAIANIDFSTALGSQATASGTNATALGESSVASYFNSTAIGQGSATTGTNQVSIGNASGYVSIPGGLSVLGNVSNATLAGTANFPAGSDVAFKRYALTTIANGNNAGVIVGTNIFVELSGPSSAFSINGIAGGRDGKFIILLNRTGQNMTIAHDSGVEPTPANRIYTARLTDSVITGNSSAMLIYSSSASRWILLNFTQ